jgi:drug/metabolite transporter (DMT)-like permease
MLIALVTPLAAVLLGMVVLGEHLEWRTIAGGALIMSGIGLVMLRRAKPSSGSDDVQPQDARPARAAS